MPPPGPGWPPSTLPAPGFDPRYSTAPGRDGRAVGSLVCGLLTIVMPILAIPAIVLGVKVLRNTGQRPWIRGRGQAIAGIACSAVAIPLALAIAIPTFLGVQHAAKAATRPTQTPSEEAPALPYEVSYAHFSASFPTPAREETVPETIAGYQMSVATVVSSGPVQVTEADVSPALPTDVIASNLESSLRTYGANADMTMTVAPTPMSFRTFQAETASFTLGSQAFQGLAFAPSGSRIYLLMAPEEDLSALEDSLQLTN